MTRFRLSDEELEAGQIFIKSDVYPDLLGRPGRFYWVVKHPPSGWSDTGTGTSHADCVHQINVRLKQAGVDVGSGVSIMREWQGDELTAIEIRREDLSE